jgi:hypothetical protein
MLIALLAVLGVDLIVIVAFLAVVLSRRRWVSHQPDAFKGARAIGSPGAATCSTRIRVQAGSPGTLVPRFILHG